MIHRDLFLAYIMLTKVLDSSRAVVLRGGSKTQAESCSSIWNCPQGELLSQHGRKGDSIENCTPQHRKLHASSSSNLKVGCIPSIHIAMVKARHVVGLTFKGMGEV